MRFENTEVHNFPGALRGMRNPLESWSNSDSEWCICDDEIDCPTCIAATYCNSFQEYPYVIGLSDLGLAQKLIKAGSDHSKFMRQIFVAVDITAPLYWWKEFDTYKMGTVANSTSTMHKLSVTPITTECFELDRNENGELLFTAPTMDIIKVLEVLREQYNQTLDKNVWRLLIQLLPSAWLQKRTVTMSYQNVRQMYFARRNHKLSEWSTDFIHWVYALPYSKELICIE